MEPSNLEEPKHQDYELQENQDEQEQSQIKNRVSYDTQLLSACKKGDYQWAQKCINKKANIHIEQGKKKWTPLVWASCKGYLNIVKLLLSKGAAQPYTVVQPANRIVIMGVNKQVKPTPLQWACFKGNTQIVLLLLKAGLHWQDVDYFGNNSVALCAAGNHLQIFKIFLQYGILLNVKNSRGHTVKELTTHKDILQLSKQYQKSDKCYSSKIAFKQNEIKHWCWICKNFFKTQNFKIQWVLKDAKSEEKNQIDGRCIQCLQKLKSNTQDLQKAMQSYDYNILTNMIQSKKALGIQFQVKFFQKAIILQQKLRTQNQILNYIHTLTKVNNYKIILKAVDTIETMVKDAKDRNVVIDQNIIEIVAKQKQRLIAQRNLRYLLDNIDTATAKREQVKNLQDIYTIAVDKKVAAQYLDVANQLKTKMTKAILAQDIYKLFIDYPVRPDPYPPPMIIDFKTKKPLDPQTKKPTDPVNLLPKPKKGKKVPKFMVPQWATQIKSLNQKIKQLEELCKLKDELNLSAQFVKECHQAIALMKKQSRYRKDMDQLQRMVDEANKKPKK